MSSLPGSCTEGGREHERADNGPRGGRTLCRGLVRELAQGRHRRGGFALRRKRRDAQPVGAQIDGVPGRRGRREHPRLLAKGVWPHRERGPVNPELELGRRDCAPDGVVAAGRSPRQRVHGFRPCRPRRAQRGVLRKIAMRFSDIILLLNTLWFGGAFIQFSIAQGNTLKILVPREERGNPIAPTLSASVAFLGGINLPIGLLSLYMLARPPFFCTHDAQLALFLFFAACHFSQFVYNVPVLMRGGRVGVAYWPVLKGPMLRIFAIDAILFAANLGVVFLLASRP